jgi:fumarate reductase subunit C
MTWLLWNVEDDIYRFYKLNEVNSFFLFNLTLSLSLSLCVVNCDLLRFVHLSFNLAVLVFDLLFFFNDILEP